MSMVPIVWATFGFFSAWSKWFPVGHNWWPWTKPGYITMTQGQSNNQWSGGIAAHPTPKNSECKNLLAKFSPWFFWIKTASSSLIIFQRAKLSMRSITHLCWCNWRTFWRKNDAGRSPRGSCSCTTMHWLTGHLKDILKEKWRRKVTKGVLFLHDNALAHRAFATQKKLAYLGFHCPDHPPYSPDLALLDYHLFPGLKSNWKFAIFCATRRSLLPQRPGGTDNFLNFFWVPAKVEAMG